MNQKITSAEAMALFRAKQAREWREFREMEKALGRRFPSRAQSALLAHGIRTVDAGRRLTLEEILAWTGIGRKSAASIWNLFHPEAEPVDVTGKEYCRHLRTLGAEEAAP